jgi:HTH-type transcriptional regulator / antitoxin HipB
MRGSEVVEQFVRNAKQTGALIRRLRRSAGLTQKELGSSAALRQATISALERGQSGVNLQTLFDVLQALQMELVVRPRKAAVDSIEDLL